MAQQKDIANTLFEAIDILVDKKIEGVQFDKTITATITDASNAANGEYIVSDGSVKFKAYCNNTKYRQNEQVMVTIPQGDFNN